ncbi:MAG: DUF393 domain-containing protein [Pseudomonadales bacterium]|nr:DUF393 domain-containing protein [Pseudomonadales bacterium]
MNVQVFYDSRCGVCRKEIEFYKRLDRENRIDWLDIFDEQHRKKFPDTTESLLKVLHVRGKDGQIHLGVDAFVVMWSFLPRPFTLFAKVAKFPIVYSVLGWGYQIFAERRYKRLYCEIR